MTSSHRSRRPLRHLRRWLRRRRVHPFAASHIATHTEAVARMEPLEPRLLLSGDVIISEFMADNDSTIADFQGDFEDWFELHNTTDQPINLNGWHLTDDPDELDQWTLPNITLGAGDFLLIFASNKNLTDPTEEMHTNFALSANGEDLLLVRPDLTVEHAFLDYPEQYEDISYGIGQDVNLLLSSGAAVSYLVPSAGDAGLGTTWTQPGFDDSNFSDTVEVPASTVVITEAHTGFIDFIEIQNVAAQTIDTSGWSIAISDNGQNINAVNAIVQTLPASMTPGQVLRWTDTAGGNPWGNNIAFATTGAGWGLVVDDVGNVVDFAAWGYSAAAIASFNVNVNGFNITAADLPWTGEGVAQNGSNSNSMQRTGTQDNDNASDFAFVSPTSQGASNNGLSLPFPDGEAPATTGIGFNVGGAGSGFEVTFIQSTGNVGSLAEAESLINTPGNHAATATGRFDVVNFLNTGAVGNYGGDLAPPSTVIGGDVDDYVLLITGKVHIPSAGDWTFGVNSDDGFGLDLTRGATNFRSEFPGPRGAADTLATFNVTDPGDYDVRLLMYDQGGGSSVEFFAAPGSHGSFSAGAFDLVGDTANGGLSVGGLGDAIATDIEDDMYNVNASLWTRQTFDVDDPAAFDFLTLHMRYDAGFVAYLNGVQVASRNAPGTLAHNAAATAERELADVAVFETINISAFLDELVAGENVLAIHGLNGSASDEDFVILPELTAGSNEGIERYFGGPTPGASNAGGFIAFVEDTGFSVDRGFFDAPFQLEITTDTPDATIVYTTNGEDPTLSNGTIYTGPTTISSTTTLRAAAFKAGFEPTNIDTQTYIFLADVVQQSPNGAPPPGFPADWGSNVEDYGMDPDIVNDPTWGPQLFAALTQIPSMSIVTDLDNLFDPNTGIYANPGNRGSDWERPASLELLDPTGGDESFQVNFGIRIRGGFSRSTNNPKHAFRLFFREEYGDSKLDYALFGDEGVDEFDKLDLRTAQNYSWSFQGNGGNTFLRDIVSRDIQGEMGQQYTRGRYYHLYINGHYWGLYQSEERPEAAFGESYFGGDRDDYDVVKSAGSDGNYTVEATDGTLDAWMSLYDIMRDGFADHANFLKAQGLNPDGSDNPNFDRLLDVDNLIDHMLIVYFTGDRDGAGSRFTAPRTNNWFGIYNRENPDGFKFFEHDSEHSFDRGDNMVNPQYVEHNNFDINDNQYWNPHWLHETLMVNPEYRQRFIDRAQLHLFKGGAMSQQVVEGMLDTRAAQIDLAIIAESARWGDAKRSTPFTKNDWLNAIAVTRNWVAGQYQTLLNQLAGEGWWPGVEAPQFRVNGVAKHGGQITETAKVSMTTLGEVIPIELMAAGSTWRYLDDGSDQGTAWRGVGFNDSTWETGQALLGYDSSGSDSGIVTTVDFIDIDPHTPDVQKNATTYFRSTFNVDNVSNVDTLTINLLSDDGAAVYINGSFAFSFNMPGQFDYATYASGTIGGDDENIFRQFSVDPGLLVNGENTIAVEMHQGNAGSSDLRFDLSIEAGEIDPTSIPVYYTLDGSDPRLTGGALSPAAVQYDGMPFTLADSAPINARVFSGGEWSALSSATFLVNTPADANNLKITEINYHPLDPTAFELSIDPTFDDNDFEFIELMNVGTEQIDLFNVRFTEGITFDFTDSDAPTLLPGQRVVVVKNLEAYLTRYGTGALIAGEYEGSLDNAGEPLLLLASNNISVADFSYSDAGAWPGRADGDGSTLEAVDVFGDYGDAENWRSSSEYLGTPGGEGLGPDNRILINEVLSHTDPPLSDAIELYNTTSNSIDISGWFLSDSSNNYQKFRIPNGTVLGAGQYLVFDEGDFNASGGTDPNDFGLNSYDGDNVYLLQANASTGELQRFVDDVSFGAAANGESFGRYPNGDGGLYPMQTRTFGGANSEPRVGPVVISEVHYNPADPGNLPVGMDVQDLEFVEIFNPTNQAVDLTDWRLRRGVDYDFAAGFMLGANETLVIIQFDPTDPLNADRLAAWEAAHGVSAATINLVGGYQGQLSNGGEAVQLQRPDQPPAEDPLFIPRLLEDEVDYNDVSPWPTQADGLGSSLHRVGTDSFGHDATSWQATAPSPGVVSADATPPSVVSVTINAGDGQRSRVTSIAYTFSEDVSLTTAALIISNITENADVSLADMAMSYDPATHTATWAFPGLEGGTLTDGNYTLTLQSAAVTDGAGNALDGDASGSAGGDHTAATFRYFGDADGDRDVDFVDLFNFRAALQSTVADPNYDPRFDIVGDGDVDFADLFQFRARFQTMLDEPVAGAGEQLGGQSLGGGPAAPDDDDEATTVETTSPSGTFNAVSEPDDDASIAAARPALPTVRSVGFASFDRSVLATAAALRRFGDAAVTKHGPRTDATDADDAKDANGSDDVIARLRRELRRASQR